MKTYKDLTNEELQFIIQNYRKLSYSELGNVLNISDQDVHTALASWRDSNPHHNLPRMTFDDFSDSWKQEIVSYYQNHSLSATIKYFFTHNDIVRRILCDNNIEEHTRAKSLEFSKIEQYGSVESYNEHMIQKQKETSLNKYGVDNFAKSKIFHEKTIATCQERYGVNNPMQSSIVKEKYKQGCIEKFGVPWPQMNEEVLQKRLETTRSRYGGSGWKSPILRQQYFTTFQKLYGGTHWSHCPELISKINQTCRDKHGVDWPCLYPEVRNSFSTNSNPNKAFAELLESNSIDYEREFGIHHYLYDFKIGNILVEINPTSTHNSTWGVFGMDATSKTYHREKRDTAVHSGYRCIHVWDWDNTDLIIKQLKSRNRVYARTCDCRYISNDAQREFTRLNHLQGAVDAKVSLGLFLNDELISVMTFGKPRYNKNYEVELLRYCSTYYVIGGAEKLFRFFVKNHEPMSIISYCDNSKFTGNVYERLGFNCIATNIGKHWYNMSTKKHITDNLLRQRGFDQLFGTNYGKGTSNEDLMKEHKFVEVYDAGQSTYVWKN